MEEDLEKGRVKYNDGDNGDEDEDIATTLKSAHLAEWIAR